MKLKKNTCIAVGTHHYLNINPLFFSENNIKCMLIVVLVLLAIALAISNNNLLHEIAMDQIKISNLILEISDLEQRLIVLQEQIEANLKKVATSIPTSTGWSRSATINAICFSCILTTVLITKIFFAYTPYLITYTAQSWNYNVISYFYPLVWSKDNIPPIFQDSMKNYFRFVFDTSLDKFVLDVQLAGTKTPITIAEFIQWVLGLS